MDATTPPIPPDPGEGDLGPPLPALSRTLRAVGCHEMMPTRLECPSSVTTGSVTLRTGT